MLALMTCRASQSSGAAITGAPSRAALTRMKASVALAKANSTNGGSARFRAGGSARGPAGAGAGRGGSRVRASATIASTPGTAATKNTVRIWSALAAAPAPAPRYQSRPAPSSVPAAAPAWSMARWKP